jgi:Flp pilus assembly protein TadG
MRTTTARFASRQQGSAALEFAFVALFVMVPLAFGISELGRAISQYNTLTKATRDAARYLTIFAPGTRTGAARCLAVSGNVSVNAAGVATCVGDPLLPGLSAANVVICEATSCPTTHQTITVPGVGAVNLVTVTIQNYQFTTLVPFVIPDITLGPISTTMRAPL